MYDSAPIHKRRKLVKTNKTVLYQNLTVIAEVYPKKNVIKWSRKTATDVINPENKGNT